MYLVVWRIFLGQRSSLFYDRLILNTEQQSETLRAGCGYIFQEPLALIMQPQAQCWMWLQLVWHLLRQFNIALIWQYLNYDECKIKSESVQ